MHYTPLQKTYVRFGYDEDDSVMVIMNRGSTPVELNPERFVERLDGFTTGADVLSGTRLDVASTFSVPARSVLLLELER